MIPTAFKIMVATITIIINIFLGNPISRGEYARYAMATDIVGEELVFTDDTENMWGIEYTDEYELGECYILIMNRNGSNSIYDDEIMDIIPAEEYDGNHFFAYTNYEDFGNLYLK